MKHMLILLSVQMFFNAEVSSLYKYKYGVEGTYNMFVTIGILNFLLINLSNLFTNITKANLPPFKYVDINQYSFIGGIWLQNLKVLALMKANLRQFKYFNINRCVFIQDK